VKFMIGFIIFCCVLIALSLTAIGFQLYYMLT